MEISIFLKPANEKILTENFDFLWFFKFQNWQKFKVLQLFCLFISNNYCKRWNFENVKIFRDLWKTFLLSKKNELYTFWKNWTPIDFLWFSRIKNLNQFEILTFHLRNYRKLIHFDRVLFYDFSVFFFWKVLQTLKLRLWNQDFREIIRVTFEILRYNSSFNIPVHVLTDNIFLWSFSS